MTDLLLLVFIFLMAGVLSVPIAARLGLGSVLGYLIAGIAISPVLSMLHVDVNSLQHFAEFGVVMMLFLVGLELEPRRLWSMRAQLLGLGGGQVALTALVTMGVAMVLHQPWSVALAIGLVLSMSSTAIVLQTLQEKGLIRSDGGQSSFAVLLFQDIAVIPMLALLPLLAMPELMGGVASVASDRAAHGGGEGNGLSLVAGLPGWGTGLVTLAAIASVVGAGSYLTGPIFRFIAAAHLRELFVATALMMVIGIALLMSLVGLSPALGTFLAGVVLANSEYRHELESDIDPFKGLLLGLFFMTVGANIDFALLTDQFASILGLTLGLIVLKAAVMYALAVAFRLRGADRWLFALGLAQAGEFGFVLLSFTVANRVIPAPLADQLLLVVALSMLLTPALFILWDRWIVPRFATTESRTADDIKEHSDVIVAGHGRVGGIVARMMRGAGLTPTIIDYSAGQLEMLKAFSIDVHYGDATRPDLLHAAGIANAKVFVIAIDGKAQITELVKYVRAHYPNVHIVARAVDRPHVFDLWHAGCRDIIRECYDSSLRMGRSTFEAMGYSRDQASRIVEVFSEMDGRGMSLQAEYYDPSQSWSQNTRMLEEFHARRESWNEELLLRSKAILSETSARAERGKAD